MTLITESTLKEAVNLLCEQDKHLGSVVNRFGPPPLWSRKPGFATLIHIILEQQVSLASAQACFDKLTARIPGLNPADFLKLSDQELLLLGFSRQKTRYCRILAQAVTDGVLDVEGLEGFTDAEIVSRLTALTGIGPWTANIYLLMALGRPDIWPTGDLALQSSIQKLYNLDHRPLEAEFLELGDLWRPYRAVAARILWHYYLSQ